MRFDLYGKYFSVFVYNLRFVGFRMFELNIFPDKILCFRRYQHIYQIYTSKFFRLIPEHFLKPEIGIYIFCILMYQDPLKGETGKFPESFLAFPERLLYFFLSEISLTAPQRKNSPVSTFSKR